MTAKEYLNQAYRLNELIESNLKELEKLEALATHITSGDTSKDRVQGGLETHDMLGDTMAKIVDLKKKINAEIDKYIDLKKEIREVINGVQNMRDMLLLRYRYSEFLTWEQIAEKMNYSLRQVYRFHDEAIEEIEIKKLVTKWH